MNSKPLHIAFDAKRLFHNFTGLGNYSRTLVQNLAHFHPEHQYHLYSPKLNNHPETQAFLNSTKFYTHTANGTLKSWWRTRGILSDLQEQKIDIYHGLSHEIPIGIRRTPLKSVVTIHDLIFKVYPDFFPWIDRQIYDFKFKYACQKANKIIAISEHTKRDIIRFYNIPSEKIQVIYQTCQEIFKQRLSEEERLERLKKYNLPKDFLLYVGSIIERKNLLSIVQALELLPTDLKIPLVVVGNGKKYKQKVQEYIADKRLEQYVYFINIDFQDLPALYQQAQLFVYPSVYEGFGIPIIEALYSQTPVITTKVSSLPEAGGPAAYYVNEPKAEQIALGIEKILTKNSLQQQMIQAGNIYTQKFDKKYLSDELMNLYNELMAM